MRYVITLIVFYFITVNCFAQSVQNQDSARMARTQQMQELIRQRQQQSVSESKLQQPPLHENSPQIDLTVEPVDVTADSAEKGAVSDSTSTKAIREKLDILQEIAPNFAEEIDVSIGQTPLAEMLRNVAKIGKVNLSIRGVDDMMVSVNFLHAKITDLIYFLCKEYNLDIDITGNIVSIFPRHVASPIPKKINVYEGKTEGSISYELDKDNIVQAAKRITEISGVNILIPQSLYGYTVSGFIKDATVDEAIASLSGGNNLWLKKRSNGIWEISAPLTANGETFVCQSSFDTDQLAVDSTGLISVQITRGNVLDIITDICRQRDLNYHFLNPINHQSSMFLSGVTFETLLSVMLAGTEFGYYQEDGIYIFGTFSNEKLNSVKIIPLMYRSVSKIDEIIPKQLSSGLEVRTFVDQNSIIVSGDQRKVQRIENFIKSIDKRVPLVTIEVIIMDVTKTEIMEAGLGFGMGDAPVKTSGKFMPGIDMTLGASSINSIINSLNGFGSVNLGKVTPRFYMTLKMLEDNGTIQIHSTPKLSTLNGNSANLTSGEKSYYKEVSTNYWGSQTPTPSESYVWKQVEANLEIKITPFVSADKQISLDIEINQSEFTERVEKDGPPGIASRSFKSIIRVQNEEMVLLGGIDRNSKTKSSSGMPYISKIPVLKWIFGSAKNNKIDHKLNVFIKPTLID